MCWFCTGRTLVFRVSRDGFERTVSRTAPYREAVEVLDKAGIGYIVGGGIAIMAYGRTRDTKDIDLYILDKDQCRALDALASAKFQVDPMPDVNWLCKGFKEGITVDFIIENVGGMHTTEETIAHGFWTLDQRRLDARHVAGGHDRAEDHGHAQRSQRLVRLHFRVVQHLRDVRLGSIS